MGTQVWQSISISQVKEIDVDSNKFYVSIH